MTTTATDKSNNRPPLDAIFAPRAVAVIGATDRPNTIGRTLMANLLNTESERKIFPINLKRHKVMGRRVYSHLKKAPEPVDLAVIATPAPTVPGIIKECVEANVRGAIIVSSGFREFSPAGAKLEEEILAEARKGDLRIIGPNCLGVMNPHKGLNATFAGTTALPGSVAFISQSGALCTAILDWSLQNKVGFSAFVSIGAMMDIDWGDLLTYFDRDYRTKSILLYMESIGNARAFLSAARETALDKPIIVLKAGKTAAAARAAVTHTGSLAGQDDVIDAAFRRSGVLRVNRIAHLFHMADVFSKQPRPRGPRLAILTNAGGPGVLAADFLIRYGGELAELSPETFDALNKLLPPHWSRGNPIDVLGYAGPERYAEAFEIVCNDPANDAILCILTPQDMTDPAETAQKIVALRKKGKKPVLASWIGGAGVSAGVEILNQGHIPTFDYPDIAARVFNYMRQYSQNLRNIYETPTIAQDDNRVLQSLAQAQEIVQSAHRAGRSLLTEIESKRLLAAYNIPTVETRLAATVDEAVALAGSIGYPVALKLHSQTITHKREVGGVQLNLPNAGAVRLAFRAIKEAAVNNTEEDFPGVTVQPMVDYRGFELILGSSIDEQFGPVLLFGLGGQIVELFDDHALALPPLTSTLARQMMKQTKIYRALQRLPDEQAVDLPALEHLLVRFSYMAALQPRIKGVDINPLLISPGGMLALDARIELHPPAVEDSDLPKLAIRPYPIQYIAEDTLKDGTPIIFRPIRPEDEELIVAFHQTLSEESVYYRYFQMMTLSRRTAHERLSRICFIDYDREMALVAEKRDPDTGQAEILAVARFIKLTNARNAEFAVIVNDDWHGRGLGSKLLSRLLETARQEGVSHIIGTVLPENYPMLNMCKKLAFKSRHATEDRVIEVYIDF